MKDKFYTKRIEDRNCLKFKTVGHLALTNKHVSVCLCEEYGIKGIITTRVKSNGEFGKETVEYSTPGLHGKVFNDLDELIADYNLYCVETDGPGKEEK